MQNLRTDYTFDASAKTIVFGSTVALENIKIITNVTDGIVIYQFNDPAKGGTLATLTLTLDYDTTAMDDADKLMIVVEETAVTNPGNVSLALIDDAVKADDAGFTVATDKVMMAGHVAVAHGSNPDAADANDAVARITNRHRVPFSIGGHPNTLTLKHANITTAVTDTAIVTVGSGTKIVVTRLTVTLDNASTVFPTVLIGFGATNTPTTTGVLAAHGGVPAGGGFTIGDGSGILGVGGDGDDLRITTTGNATGNGLQVTVSYYTIES